MVLSNKEWLDKMNEIISAIKNGGGDSQVIEDMLSNMWISSATYNVGDYVLYDNNIWKCLVQNSNITPSEGNIWTRVNITSEISTLNSNLTLLNKYEGGLLGGQDKEIYFSPGEYFEITIIGNILRMCKIIGQFRSNGIADYWVEKPSESTIQVSSNTNRIIIGNPIGAGSIDIFVKYIKKVN